ncbi:APY7, partial [Symbiodinium microadriaticum]
QEVPQASHRYTPISLKATAGVRQLPSEEQEWLIHSTLHHLSRGPFTVDARQTRVLSGAEE